MAGARIEKLGTIFSRAKGLLKAGGMQWEKRPIWYDIYEAHPPLESPSFERPLPKDLSVPSIFYKEDLIRARFAREISRNENPIEFMELYKKKRETLSENDAFIKAVEESRAARQSVKKSVEVYDRDD